MVDSSQRAIPSAEVFAQIHDLARIGLSGSKTRTALRNEVSAPVSPKRLLMPAGQVASTTTAEVKEQASWLLLTALQTVAKHGLTVEPVLRRQIIDVAHELIPPTYDDYDRMMISEQNRVLLPDDDEDL